MIISFGYKHGIPEDVDRVVDVRDLPNPHAYSHLRHLTGHDEAVRRFLVGFTTVHERVLQLTNQYRAAEFIAHQTGTRQPVWAIGCTGGRHRSVVVATELGARVGVQVTHRDCPKVVEAGEAGEAATGYAAEVHTRKTNGGD